MSADWVLLTVVATELDAEMIQQRLELEGIAAFRQVTNFGAGSFDGVARGSHEVLVRPEDLEAARALIDG